VRFLTYMSLAATIALLATPVIAEQSWEWPPYAPGTGPNQARMIQLSPGETRATPWVHGIWDAVPFQHVYSTDGGTSWTGPINNGNPYPVNFASTLNVPTDGHPWVSFWSQTAFEPPRSGLFVGVWRNHADQYDWRWQSVFSTEGSVGTVSATLSSTGGEPMVYAVTSTWEPGQGWCLWFLAFDTLNNVTSNLLDVGSSADYKATIDYTPSDVMHIAYQRDGHIWYITCSPITPGQIRNSVPIQWYWQTLPLSRGLSAYNRNASIDADGEYVYCSWRGPNTQGQDIGDVRRRSRSLQDWPPDWFPTVVPENISQSPTDESDYPQCGTGTTTTWQEACSEPSNHNEVYAAFPGSGPVNISSDPGFNNLWPQNAVMNPVLPEPWSIYLHALWSQEDLSYPYTDLIHYKRYRYIPSFLGNLEYPTYLKAELGESLQSPYCVERSGYKAYGEMRVDYGLSRLRYVLPYLDPSHGYLAECILYNGEKTAITQRIEIGGVLVAKVTLKPASCDTFRVTIPRVAYKSTRAKVDIVRESGPFACLASTVKVYEKTERQNGDGELAGSVGQLQRGVVATPNPFSGRCLFRLETGLATGATARIHDASGRFVRRLALQREAKGGGVASWDGADECGRQTPAGVYYCRIAGQGYSASAKVVKR
jgi:hypothetical protein